MEAASRRPRDRDGRAGDGARGGETVPATRDPRRAERELATLADEIAELAAHIDAATWRLLELICEFDERGGWHDGFASCAHWLNWRIGLGMVAAREKVRVARVLPSLPETSDALRRGLVSYSKVRAMTRIATPENEALLLTMAQAGTASHVERIVRGYRRANPAEENARARRHQEERYLRLHTDDDGMLVIAGRLAPEAGAVVKKALEAAMRALTNRDGRGSDEGRLTPDGSRQAAGDSRGAEEGRPPDDSAEALVVTKLTAPMDRPVSRPADIPADRPDLRPRERHDSESPAQRRADALALVAVSALARELERGTPADHRLVMVHADADVLADPAADGRSELEEGPHVSAESSRRVACDASVVRVTHGDGGNVLDVGRRTRAIPARLRRALAARDDGCRFPGCTHRRYLEGHHLTHWAEGGETKLGNLVHLCPFHHRLVHEGGYRIEGNANGELTFVRPGGTSIRVAGEPPLLPEDAPAAPVAQHRAGGIAPRAAETQGTWMGEPVDYGWAVAGLCERRARA
jgi:hypothetical protein